QAVSRGRPASGRAAADPGEQGSQREPRVPVAGNLAQVGIDRQPEAEISGGAEEIEKQTFPQREPGTKRGDGSPGAALELAGHGPTAESESLRSVVDGAGEAAVDEARRLESALGVLAV